ncbi:MAG: SoxR reducing system RseC family protein [Oscillospiraceae bacterium]|jgi:hypothetical protein|nr:SoxR reducing system RseC family protein [Oscillospiraceae bacterium]
MTGVIKKLLPNSKAEVLVSRAEDCADCPSCGVCSAKREITVKAHNIIGAEVGDAVTIKSSGLFKVEITGAAE